MTCGVRNRADFHNFIDNLFKLKIKIGVIMTDSIVSAELIERKIYLIRNKKVMLDSDLAELYNVETKVLNQAVKRNIARFPEDFMFQLNERVSFETFKVTICDLEERAKYQVFAACFYRKRRGYAFQRS